MKNQQNNTSVLSALLRTADGVDTLETNSLCCAAAGIIAPPSVTAEALVPHEKLRGAALADATLTAQIRPLAQPVVEYTYASKVVDYAPEAKPFRVGCMSKHWKLVPVDPTETMVINGFESEPDECFSDEEAWEQYQEMSGCQQAAFRAKLCWAAMIASAPTPPQPIYDEAAELNRLLGAAREMLRITGIANQGSNAYNRAIVNLHEAVTACAQSGAKAGEQP